MFAQSARVHIGTSRAKVKKVQQKQQQIVYNIRPHGWVTPPMRVRVRACALWWYIDHNHHVADLDRDDCPSSSAVVSN